MNLHNTSNQECKVFILNKNINQINLKYEKLIDIVHEKNKDKKINYYNELKKLTRKQNKEIHKALKQLLLEEIEKGKVPENGDLIENLFESGYRTSGVYMIEKKNNIIYIKDIGKDYDDYGYIDGNKFTLSKNKLPGYWNNAPFNRAYWHIDILPEPISSKYWSNVKLFQINEEKENSSIINIGWVKLKFLVSKDRLLFFLNIAKVEKVKVLYFQKHSDNEVILYEDWMPSYLREILNGSISITENE